MQIATATETRDLLIEVIDRYMTSYRPTRIDLIRTVLRDKFSVLNELVSHNVLAESHRETFEDGPVRAYFPRMLAFEYVADEKRKKVALRSVESILRRCKHCVLSSGSLKIELGRRDGEHDAVWEGNSFLLADFSHCVEAVRFDHISSHVSIVLKPAIRDFDTAERAWVEELSQRGIEQVKPTRLYTKPERKAAAAETKPAAKWFSFMANRQLREIVTRDYVELLRLGRSGLLKTRFILIGGIVEGLLLDALSQRLAEVANTVAGKKERRNIEEWRLSSLLDAAVELNMISRSAQSFGHSLREFRNLVHPGLELRAALTIDTQELEIAERILSIVTRDLEKSAKSSVAP